MRPALLVLFTLAGCASQPALPGAGGPLHSQGFTLAPPAGGEWVVGSSAPASPVFTKRTGTRVPYSLTAGAQAINDTGLANALQQEAQAAARAWLARRLEAPQRDNLGLDVRPASLHGARCAAYDASQVDRRIDPERILPDHVDDRSQYVQHGLVCAHPRVAGVVVQVFYNEQFLRDGAPAVRVGAAEVKAFFDGVTWE